MPNLIGDFMLSTGLSSAKRALTINERINLRYILASTACFKPLDLLKINFEIDAIQRWRKIYAPLSTLKDHGPMVFKVQRLNHNRTIPNETQIAALGILNAISFGIQSGAEHLAHSALCGDKLSLQSQALLKMASLNSYANLNSIGKLYPAKNRIKSTAASYGFRLGWF
ncbi:hypothetical protein V6259_18005 [Marinomonas sp. TI.3.20]|uniref:hypothetical protein n=1 Tax=Marinomonas sp. TI.3.20 TaxID=3121296 RepID=UPI00311FD240